MRIFAKAPASRSLTRKGVIAGIAIVGASALVLSGCASTDTGDKPADTQEDLVLEIGTLLPQTGELAFLGPPEEAGVALAAKEINEADMGIKVNVTYGDSGDPDNKAYATTVPNLISKKVSVIVGAAASGVSKLVIDQITGAGTLMISPANTSPDFTEYADDNLYWRTAPSDLLQGEVLGNLIAADGISTLGIIAINDAYGSGLQGVVESTFTEAGGTVVSTNYFNAGDTNFASQISSVLAQKPDAIALITFDQSKTIIPALKDAGFDNSNLYLVDGNTSPYGDELAPASLTGAKGTQPGPQLEDDFVQRLKDAFSEVNSGKEMGDAVSYGAEAYDATVLVALAALAAGSTDGKDIASKMQEVSGGSGDGVTATDFKSAAQTILDGGVADYDGYSGPITFDEHGDPTEATIGIFQYGEDNLFTRIN